MILIADSGSTKTTWCLITTSGKPEKQFTTSGINPFYQNSEDILKILKTAPSLDINSISSIFFYGAGCANEEKKAVVKKALSTFFQTQNISIESDLLGATRSLCLNKEGISCILGTGSNSCFYDGNSIIQNISPLGYIIGDEGSGAFLGKLLIADILKNQLPQKIITQFYNEYELTPESILNSIYKMPFPNRFLAQFSKFIAQHINHPELEKIVVDSFNLFIERNILQYQQAHTLKINFTGSIAYHFKTILLQCLSKHQLTAGTISKSPMDGLIKFHAPCN